MQTLGLYTAQAQGTSNIQGLFDASGSGSVFLRPDQSLHRVLCVERFPDRSTTGQTVIADASAFATSVQELSQSLNATGNQLNQQISSTVAQINTLATQIQQYNQSKLTNTTPDPGADANLENTLESLSQLPTSLRWLSLTAP